MLCCLVVVPHWYSNYENEVIYSSFFSSIGQLEVTKIDLYSPHVNSHYFGNTMVYQSH